MEKARAHLFIQGIVQGVSYRFFTLDLAQRLRLNGWVRNLRDGRVEAIFEGDRNVIEEAVTECREGPPGARVTGVELTWEERPEGLRGFEIRH